jgi:hypothetical protein
MSKISPQTKTFIILFSFAVVGTYVCLVLWSNLVWHGFGSQTYYVPTAQTNQVSAVHPTAAPQAEKIPAVDTTGWKTYTNSQYQISFLYKPTWKVLAPVTKDGFTVLQIDPGPKFYNIKIYISPKEFYLLAGQPATTEIIDNQKALNVINAMYGIEANNLYYTFNVGYSMSLMPEFDALVHSVKFQ